MRAQKTSVHLLCGSARERTDMRLDVYLQSTGMAKSRTRAREYIESGFVTVNGKTARKPSEDVCDTDDVTVDIPADEYVGRGAKKLEGALDTFSVDPMGLKCIDVGASTGGFTEVLLRRGAEFVCAVDSGHGQLDHTLARDPRVRNAEGINARYMTSAEVGEGYSLAVMDVSFISQTYIHPALFSLMEEDAELITLVKPQFELDARSVGKGVVTKPENRYKALLRVYESVLIYGFHVSDAILSPIKGGDGNTEYLFLVRRGEEDCAMREKLKLLSKQ